MFGEQRNFLEENFLKSGIAAAFFFSFFLPGNIFRVWRNILLQENPKRKVSLDFKINILVEAS